MERKEPPKKHINLGNFNPRSLMGYSSKMETKLIILILIGKKYFKRNLVFAFFPAALKKYSMLHHLYVTLSFLLSGMLTFISSSCLQDIGGNDRLYELRRVKTFWERFLRDERSICFL